LRGDNGFRWLFGARGGTVPGCCPDRAVGGACPVRILCCGGVRRGGCRRGASGVRPRRRVVGLGDSGGRGRRARCTVAVGGFAGCWLLCGGLSTAFDQCRVVVVVQVGSVTARLVLFGLMAQEERSGEKQPHHAS